MTLKTTAVVLILSFFLSNHLFSQQGPDQWAAEFIEVYNSKEPTKVKKYLLENFNKGYHGTTKYWLGVHREFGPVDFFSMGRDTLNGRAILWTRSRLTKNFVGFSYILKNSSPFTISRMGVVRGIAPSSLKRKDKTIPYIKESLNQYLDVLDSLDVFSGVVLLARGDELILEKAVNYADKKTGKLNELDTRFLIASTTKLITSVAINQLIESGQINYSDPISKYLPDYPKHIGDQVTIHHLLTHTSGIELDEIGAFNKGVKKISNLSELYDLHLKNLSKLKNYSTFSLKNEYNYTNEGFDLLGYLVEKVSGMSFYKYVSEKVLKPAAMNNSGDFQAGVVMPELAKGYILNNSGQRKLNTKDLPLRARPAGLYYSTSSDMYKLIRSLQKHELVSKETFEQITTPKITAFKTPFSSSEYGYGVMLDKSNGIASWGHPGAAPGVGSRCLIYKESGFIVIILSNYDKAAGTVSNYIRDLIHYDLN